MTTEAILRTLKVKKEQEIVAAGKVHLLRLLGPLARLKIITYPQTVQKWQEFILKHKV